MYVYFVSSIYFSFVFFSFPLLLWVALLEECLSWMDGLEGLAGVGVYEWIWKDMGWNGDGVDISWGIPCTS